MWGHPGPIVLGPSWRDEASTMRVGIGHDTHRLVEGRPLILGGVAIEHPRGLLGHSDADVVLHAVADALLGAAGLGDIGEHFPDTDPKWKGLDGGRLLVDVVALVAQGGWVVGNCDVVIHAQEPKLTPHKPAIRANVARLLGIAPDQVNVKAKTGEHVGPIGRGEAIACEVAVLLWVAEGRKRTTVWAHTTSSTESQPPAIVEFALERADRDPPATAP